MEEVKVKMSVLDDGVELPRPHGWRNRRAHHGGALGRPRRRLERARASVVAAALVIAVDTFVVLTDKAEEKKFEKTNKIKLAAAVVVLFPVAQTGCPGYSVL